MEKIKLQRGNSPVRDKDGYVEGTLVRVTMGRDIRKFRDWDKAFEVEEVEKCIFHFEFIGASGATFKVQHKCFPRLDSAKHFFRGQGRGMSEVIDYSKLTKTCLNLGFLTYDNVDRINEDVFETVSLKLANINCYKVRFIPVIHDEKTKEYSIILDSLCPTKQQALESGGEILLKKIEKLQD